jgi:hypothetical protein
MLRRRLLLAAVLLLAGCGGGGSEPKAQATPVPAFAYAPGEDCPISAEQASEILEAKVTATPAPGAICQFGDKAGNTSMAFGVTNERIDTSNEKADPRPQWGTGAVLHDGGCERRRCSATAWIPNGGGTAFITVTSRGGQAERQIDDFLALLKSQ